MKALMRGKKKFWMKNWWCDESKLLREVMSAIRISLNSSWQSVLMQVVWKKVMNCLIVSTLYLRRRLFSLFSNYTILMGALAAMS